MSTKTLTHSLTQLANLRQREVDSLATDMAEKQRVRQRFLSTLERIDSLYQGSGASGAASPVFSLNCANYKQSVLQMAQRHREDLARQDADIAAAGVALQAAALRHGVLTQLIERHLTVEAHAERRTEQKSQDDMGAQLWWRARS